VFDVSGALVATLMDDALPAGHHQAVWTGRDDRGRAVPSGVYFYRIVAGSDIETREMMLIK
jgi:flagellar hook assembly protein FlgD